MVLNIVTYGDPRLKEDGRIVEDFGLSLQELIDDMLETMYASHGIGLAAQQVGRFERVTVIDVRHPEDVEEGIEEERDMAVPPVPMPLVLVNPELFEFEGEEVADEGCLSFPELFAPVRRAASVRVKANDRNGNPIEFRATGLLARAIQHETDHLDGRLFIERMDAFTRLKATPRIRRIEGQTQSAYSV
jgi:peptide deformylase